MTSRVRTFTNATAARSAAIGDTVLTAAEYPAAVRAGASWAVAAKLDIPSATATAAASVLVLRFIRMWLR